MPTKLRRARGEASRERESRCYAKRGCSIALPIGVQERSPGRYLARKQYKGRIIYLGSFASAHEAHAAYLAFNPDRAA